MTNLKKFFLYSVIYILCVSSFIISSTNFSSNEKTIEKRNVKRSIKEINSLKYDSEIMDDLSSYDRQKRNIKIKPRKYKWNLAIKYFIQYPLNRWLIKRVLKTIEQSTCLRFNIVNSLNSFAYGINFYSSCDCNSPLGRMFEKGWQNIGIGDQCYNHGGVLRLVLRTLGVIYEHNRIDRNFYVKVHPENMYPKDFTNFEISRTTAINNLHLPYEYGSLMHFGMYNFSKNGGKTLSLRDHHYEYTVGQQEVLTFNDIKTLNMYYCSNICKFKIICNNHGYQDPNDCNKCICIDGFDGNRCEYHKVLRGCTVPVLTVKREPRFLKFYGKENCFYHLKASRFKKIKIVILKIRMRSIYPLTCSVYNSFEVKYWKDKTIVGARFCQQRFPKYIISHNNYVILHYNSFEQASYVHMYFKGTFR
ncbi:Astacin-like metalloendopeptidase [Strongyloides ratti]|uniref:Metalloendopeptidase n=1 Tax=Strongyloides ratti TaxID=34506 RepID=A0A090LER3_STRRB|nr:Astacin-like metalloendopeptidase [Strongyloides ratti]CEF68251.2 Astacin-like metalloendopeptidase [Strongyloides ratti]